MHSEQFYLYLLNQVNDGVYFVDPWRRITEWNHAAEKITGYRREQVLGQFCMANILQHVDEEGNQLCLSGCPLAETLRDHQPREAQVYLHHADGHRVHVQVQVVPILEDGKVVGAAEIFREHSQLTEILSQVETLQRAAMLDALTGLINRRMLQTELEVSIQAWDERQVAFSVLFIDVDYFKHVNDQHGHQVGDRALQMVARSLAAGIRKNDLIGRWGGEEFLAIIAGAEQESLRRVSERMRMLVEHSFLTIEETRPRKEQARLTVSIGGATVQPGDTISSLVERADQALYLAKSRGRNQVVVV